MSGVSVREYKIHNLRKEYGRYTTYIFNFQNHINRCLSEHTIDINSRNNYLKNLNDLLRSINISHNDKTHDIFSKNDDDKTILSKTMELPDIMDTIVYDDFKYLLESCKAFNMEYINKDKLVDVFSNPFIGINTKLVDLGLKIGFYNLDDALSIIIGEQYNNLFDSETRDLLDVCIRIFVPVKYGTEDSKEDDDIFAAKKVGSLSEILIDNCAEVKIKNSLTNKYMVFVGYFINDSLNIMYRTSEACNKVLHSKRRVIEDSLEKRYDIDKRFKSLYIKNNALSDFIVLNQENFITQLEKDYTRHKELIKLRFMDLMKEFVTDVTGSENIENMYNIIRLLLLGTKENVNVAGLLFDVTKDRKNKNETIANIIYRNLRYVSQVKLRKTYSDIKNELERIKSITFNDIDMEKQIALCKNMHDSAKKAAMIKMEEMKSSNNEYYKQLLYVKTLINYPWPGIEDERMFADIGKSREKSKEYLTSVREKIGKKVYGHALCKNTICEVMSTWLKNPKSSGSAFGLVGPPGVGKTLIARAIGDALGIPFVQITLGGQNDGELLHGHGYTYSAAQPGMVVKKMVEAGSSRCVMYFDELDKCSKKYDNNEIFDILIHMIDPNTNNEFQDRFFQEIKFPLCNVIFIFSYNDSDVIDPILLDRIEEIRVEPYSIKDKINISRDFLLKELCEETGISTDEVKFSNKLFESLIEDYTLEPGVRSLKRKIGTILRKLNKDSIFEEGPFKNKKKEMSKKNPIVITKKIIEGYLGKPKVKIRMVEKKDRIGQVNGLYATQSGDGGILPIQTRPNFTGKPNPRELVFTGKQQDTMRESVKTALTPAFDMIKPSIAKKYVKKNKYGFHVHTPCGSIPKDGPSAGAAFATSFISVILGKKVRHDLAMTGEIESMRKISAIGGLRYKLTGAKKAGVHLVLVPKDNKDDIDKIKKEDPDLISGNFKIKYVNTLIEVLKEAIIDFDENDFDENII